MCSLVDLRAAAFAIVVIAGSVPALAQQSDEMVTSDEVKAEISQAMDAVRAYTVQQRDEALVTAHEGLVKLDAEIERREKALRENWAELDEATREEYGATVSTLRAARNELGERVGALQTGSADAWVELKQGFSNAYDAFEARWREADTDD